MYKLMSRLTTLYNLLEDGLSKQIFQARLLCDLDQSEKNAQMLCALRSVDPESENLLRSRDRDLAELASADCTPLYLYGISGNSHALKILIENTGIPVAGYISRGAERYADGFYGKPVYSPEWLLSHAKEVKIIIAVSNQHRSYDEIEAFLLEKHFPKERILPYFQAFLRRPITSPYRHSQYFEFPEYYIPGTAFVDAGCCDGGTSIEFSLWCQGRYSRIYAFEPDSVNYERCRRHLQKKQICNVELIQAGLFNEEKTVRFNAFHDGGSRITSESLLSGYQVETIQTVTLDQTVGADTVGFIKMDIEGAEYEALHGAERTIKRDRPLLAVCVYHKPGDLPAIMDYCKELVPEYHFWVRHYGTPKLNPAYETVLYAAVPNP